MLPVTDMSAVARKVLAQLEAVSSLPAVTILVGWDGSKIVANLGAYRKVSKELPFERVTVTRGASLEEATSRFAVATARLQQSLKGLTGRRSGRPPKAGHGWRRAIRSETVARGGSED